MKKIVILITFLLGFNFLSACDCVPTSLAESYNNNLIVAKITILKTHDNDPAKRIYKADVKFDKIFKGVPNGSTLTVSGLTGLSPENLLGDACEVGLQKGDKYLIFLKNTEEIISTCTPHYRLDKKDASKSKIAAAENLFSFLGKDSVNNISFKSYFENNKDGKSTLSKVKNFHPKNNFAVYELLFNRDKEVAQVNIISGFGDHDNEIATLIKRNFWIHPLNISDSKVRIALIYIPEYVKNENIDHISSDLN